MNMEEELSKKIGTLSQSSDDQKNDNKVNYSQIKPQEESTNAGYNVNKGEQNAFPKAPEENVINVEQKIKKDDNIKDVQINKKVDDIKYAPKDNIIPLKEEPEKKKK